MHRFNRGVAAGRHAAFTLLLLDLLGLPNQVARLSKPGQYRPGNRQYPSEPPHMHQKKNLVFTNAEAGYPLDSGDPKM